jgi:hypothetical protein
VTDFDPWHRPGWTKQPTLAAYRAAWDRLDVPHRATLLGDDVDDGPAYDDAVTEFFDLATDEMMRRPVDARATKRATRARKVRATRKARRAQTRAALAGILTTPGPSRGAVRLAQRLARQEQAAAVELQEAA